MLKFNGALWVSHGDPDELLAISQFIVEVGGPPRINWITWDKYNGATTDKGFMDGFTVTGLLRSFQPMAEYLIYHAMTATDANQYSQGRQFIFEPLRAYLDEEKKRAGFKTRQVAEHFQKKTGSRTVTGMAGHWFTNVQWSLPTEENYQWLRDLFNQSGGEYFRQEYEYLRQEYKYLRREYEDLRPTFNNPGLVSSVWQGPPAKRNGHETPKPEWLLERIIKATSNEGDLIFDPFMGSGTTAVAADRLERRWFGCDISEEYVAMANKRIAKDRQNRAQMEMQI